MIMSLVVEISPSLDLCNILTMLAELFVRLVGETGLAVQHCVHCAQC